MIRYFVLVLLFGWFFILILPVMWIHCIFRKHIKVRTRYNYLRFVIKFVSFILGVKYHIDGMENIPSDKPVLLVGNHQSAFDPLALIAILKNPFTMVSKKETLKQPYIGTFVKNLDGYFIDRQDLLVSARLFKQIGEDMTSKKAPVVLIYPEGTRTKNSDLSLLEFKPGALKPAYVSQATIVPISYSGTYRVLKKKWLWRNHVYISFHAPLDYEQYKDTSTVELAKKLQNQIQLRANELNKLNPMEDWYKSHF